MTMQLGMIGLGRMGANIVRRILRDGHTAVAYDNNPESVDELEKEGAVGARTLQEFIEKLEKPRVAWVMIPAGITGKVVDDLAELMEPGDIIIDGGNSNYRDDIDRAAALKPRGIHYVDIGTSGGVYGLERGYCMMIGGEADVVAHIDPLLASIAPGLGDIPRTPGRQGDPAPEEQGYLHCGPSGSGHFVKMVHNGIEYGMMAAY
ncbi:MAG TPA: NADP-dependent phosphogluconate dehydrogenase, partial [Jatrophihabitans sp.]|nr:NADP-dependent phosphogluconate dehydrogenase [Jatrophihabitans sp.]